MRKTTKTKRVIRHKKSYKPRKSFRKKDVREVKYVTVNSENNGLVNSYVAAPTTTLYAADQQPWAQNFKFLEGIAQGTSAGSRIGDSIFVKFIDCKLTIYNTVSENTVFRIIIFTSTKGKFTDFASFFSGAFRHQTYQFNRINRDSVHQVVHDKLYKFTTNSAINVGGSSVPPQATTSFPPAVKNINIRIPVYRTVIYNSGSNVPKNEKDMYQMAILSSAPLQVTSQQTGGYSMSTRVYFTDP